MDSETADISTPALLRAAWMTYGAAMRRALDEAGFDDIPRNGLYVIGSLARAQSPLADIIRALNVSKQAAGQLIDTLVLRGYVERTVDPLDRRRLTITLTDRGQAAAIVQRGAAASLDAKLLHGVGPDGVARMREALLVLVTAMTKEEEA